MTPTSLTGALLALIDGWLISGWLISGWLISGWLISGWKVFEKIPDGIATHDSADITFRETSLEKR